MGVFGLKNNEWDSNATGSDFLYVTDDSMTTLDVFGTDWDDARAGSGENYQVQPHSRTVVMQGDPELCQG